MSITTLLPELQQLEMLLKDYPRQLSAETLCAVAFQRHTFPVYALSLGSQAKDIPTVVFVGGIHGLERIGTQVVLAFLETLLARLRWDLTLEAHEQVRIVFTLSQSGRHAATYAR